jgi:hypothetical protein
MYVTLVKIMFYIELQSHCFHSPPVLDVINSDEILKIHKIEMIDWHTYRLSKLIN